MRIRIAFNVTSAFFERLTCENTNSIYSAGFRTNEVDPDLPTEAVGHTCSGNLGIVKILRYIRSDMYSTNLFWQEDVPPGQRSLVLVTIITFY